MNQTPGSYYWPVGQIDYHSTQLHTQPPFAFASFFGSYEYVSGGHQYYQNPAIYYATAPYHLANAQAAIHPRSRTGAHLQNGVFVPTAMDIARGRVNQAVYEARFKHEYTDNTLKATQGRLLFDKYFGTDPKNLLAWQDICFFCGRDPDDMPTTIRACKVFLRNKYVNILEFIAAVDEFMASVGEGRTYTMNIPTFQSAKKLEHYSRKKGLICPARVGRGNDLFRFMLTKWF